MIPSLTDENLLTESVNRSKIVFMKPNNVRSITKTQEGKTE